MKKVADFVGRWCNWIVGSLYVAGAVAFAIIGPVHSQTNPGLRLQGSFVVGDCVEIVNRNVVQSSGAGCGGSGGSGTVTSISAADATIVITPDPLVTTGTIAVGVIGTGNLPDVLTAGGPIGSATVTPVITWDAKGRLTVVSSATIAPPFSAITGNLTLSQFPSIANNTVLANISGGSAVPAAINATQLTALVNDCTATVGGKVPTPPNNTTTFLRGDCTFAALPSASTSVAGIAQWATAAQFRANTSSLVLTTDQVWSAADYVSLTSGTNVAVDMATGFNFTLSLAHNATLTNPTNTKNGQTGVIYVVQTGGSNTLAYGSNFKWPGGTACTLSTAAGAVDRITYIVRSSTFIDVQCVKDIK